MAHRLQIEVPGIGRRRPVAPLRAIGMTSMGRRPDPATNHEAPCAADCSSAHPDAGGTTKSLPTNSV